MKELFTYSALFFLFLNIDKLKNKVLLDESHTSQYLPILLSLDECSLWSLRAFSSLHFFPPGKADCTSARISSD